MSGGSSAWATIVPGYLEEPPPLLKNAPGAQDDESMRYLEYLTHGKPARFEILYHGTAIPALESSASKCAFELTEKGEDGLKLDVSLECNNVNTAIYMAISLCLDAYWIPKPSSIRRERRTYHEFECHAGMGVLATALGIKKFADEAKNKCEEMFKKRKKDMEAGKLEPEKFALFHSYVTQCLYSCHEYEPEYSQEKPWSIEVKLLQVKWGGAAEIPEPSSHSMARKPTGGSL